MGKKENVEKIKGSAHNFVTKLTKPKVATIAIGALVAITAVITIVAINIPEKSEAASASEKKISYKNSYTVTFNSNGGSSVPTQYIEAGITVRRPHNPAKDNFIFDGWYEDETLTSVFDFDIVPKGSLTLYAKWRSAEETTSPTTDSSQAANTTANTTTNSPETHEAENPAPVSEPVYYDTNLPSSDNPSDPAEIPEETPDTPALPMEDELDGPKPTSPEPASPELNDPEPVSSEPSGPEG